MSKFVITLTGLAVCTVAVAVAFKSEVRASSGKVGNPSYTVDPDEIGRDTAMAIRRVTPPTCVAHDADFRWATCHDTVETFDAALKCAQKQRTQVAIAKSSFVRAQAMSDCGEQVYAAGDEMLNGLSQFFDDLVPWLQKNRARLEPVMERRTLGDACELVDCSTLPLAGWDKYAKASLMKLNELQCPKDIFQCGRDRSNVCGYRKITYRLNTACDLSTSMVGDPLLVRATGLRLN